MSGICQSWGGGGVTAACYFSGSRAACEAGLLEAAVQTSKRCLRDETRGRCHRVPLHTAANTREEPRHRRIGRYSPCRHLRRAWWDGRAEGEATVGRMGTGRGAAAGLRPFFRSPAASGIPREAHTPPRPRLAVNRVRHLFWVVWTGAGGGGATGGCGASSSCAVVPLVEAASLAVAASSLRGTTTTYRS